MTARAVPPPAVAQPASRRDGSGITAVLAGWRAEATHLRERYGAEGLALLCEAHARELETALVADAREAITLAEAVRESGYSQSHLRAMVAAGELTNVGRKGAPRLLRGELPTKHGARPAPEVRSARSPRKRGTFDAATAARRALRGHPET